MIDNNYKERSTRTWRPINRAGIKVSRKRIYDRYTNDYLVKCEFRTDPVNGRGSTQNIKLTDLKQVDIIIKNTKQSLLFQKLLMKRIDFGSDNVNSLLLTKFLNRIESDLGDKIKGIKNECHKKKQDLKVLLTHNGTIFNFSQIYAQLMELKQNLLKINKFIRLEGIDYDRSYQVSTPAEYALEFKNTVDYKNKTGNNTNQNAPEKEVKSMSTQTENEVKNTSTSTCVAVTKNKATQVEQSIFRTIIDCILNIFFSQ